MAVCGWRPFSGIPSLLAERHISILRIAFSRLSHIPIEFCRLTGRVLSRVTDSKFRCSSTYSRNALDAGNDKGVRFRFLDGLLGVYFPSTLPFYPTCIRHELTLIHPIVRPGRVVCAAHNDHWVGIA